MEFDGLHGTSCSAGKGNGLDHVGLGLEATNRHPSQKASELKWEQIFLLYVTFCGYFPSVVPSSKAKI